MKENNLIVDFSYTSKMNRTFGIMLLVQPLIASLGIILSLFCVMVNFWYAGIGYIIFTYTQLLAMCAVGQSVQNNVKTKQIIYLRIGNIYCTFTISSFPQTEPSIAKSSLRIGMDSVFNWRATTFFICIDECTTR